MCNMKISLIVVLVILVSAAIVGGIIASRYLAVFNIRGVVNVGERGYALIDAVLNISSDRGTKVLRNVAVVDIENETSILFRILDREVVGNVKLCLGGKAILESGSRRYVISMPCLLVKGMPCYRVQMVIPGYDAPLRVEPGRYNVSLVLSWRAVGRGSFRFTLAIEKVGSEVRAEIIPVGTKPLGSTSSWVVAKGSTRSYALLVDKTVVKAGRDGYGRVRAWVWMFSSSGSGKRVFKIVLLGEEGRKVARLELSVEKHGVYYQVLLLVLVKPGRYVLRVTYPTGSALEVPIEVLNG